MRLHLVSLAIIAMTIAGAEGAEIAAPSTVEAVTVYPDGATVTRTLKVELPAGASSVLATDFPAGLDPSSLRVAGQGGAAIQIGGVDSRLVRPSLDPDKVSAIEGKIRTLEDEIDRLDGTIAAAEAQRNFMDSLVRSLTRPVGGKDAPPQLDPSHWSDALQLVGKGHADAHAVIHGARQQQRDMRLRIEELRRQMKTDPGRRQPHRDIRVAVNAAAAGTAELQITYQIHGAGWEPVYAARLSIGSEQPALELLRRAVVRQHTGEAWDEVRLTLSTTRPSGATSAPELRPLLAMLVKDVRQGALRKSRKRADTESDDVGMIAAEPAVAATEEMRDSSVPARKASQQMARLELAGFNAVYKIPGRVTLPSGGDTKTVTIAAHSAKPNLVVRTTPERDQHAYLHAAFTHEEEAPLLPGRVALFRDSVFVGNGYLDLTSKGQEAELGFGVDDRVAVRFTETDRNTGERGLLSSSRIDERHFAIQIENNHDRAMRIVVSGRVPYTESEDIEVTFADKMTPPTDKNVDDKRGIIAWDHEYEAAEKKTLTLAYRLTWPEDQQIVVRPGS